MAFVARASVVFGRRGRGDAMETRVEVEGCAGVDRAWCARRAARMTRCQAMRAADARVGWCIFVCVCVFAYFAFA